MGKIGRQRKKLHLEGYEKNVMKENVKGPTNFETAPELVIKLQENLFEGVKIDINSLNKNLSDDKQSVRSFKSEISKTLPKKDKLKLRREMLMKKFEVMNEQKKSKKRKKPVIVGDLYSLHDALPSLETLLKSRKNIPYKQNIQPKKKKGIEKAHKQKKNHLQGIKIFQQIFKNKHFQEDPQLAISQHVASVLEEEKNN